MTPPRPLKEEDDRSQFDRGRESLNSRFRRHAWGNHASGASRVNVIADARSGLIIGYVTLSAAQIERAFLGICNRGELTSYRRVVGCAKSPGHGGATGRA